MTATPGELRDRGQLKTQDAQITELKTALREREDIIATLHGELARKS